MIRCELFWTWTRWRKKSSAKAPKTFTYKIIGSNNINGNKEQTLYLYAHLIHRAIHYVLCCKSDEMKMKKNETFEANINTYTCDAYYRHTNIHHLRILSNRCRNISSVLLWSYRGEVDFNGFCLSTYACSFMHHSSLSFRDFFSCFKYVWRTCHVT